ncbi:hypothetical protein VP01_3319g1 [Puccinia sorghi]|uniref:Uncharacterized protein n=1 Tax=Puccinia sorghi TaxID=27349 RepID=A0A0L6UX92_9BASI|nr:hypothetical protein VP01_3319g1 [Puccinia sorghi]
MLLVKWILDHSLAGACSHEQKLLDEERRSDEFLFTQKLQHNVKISFIYPSSLPGNVYMLLLFLAWWKGLQLIKELCKGFLLGKDSIS